MNSLSRTFWAQSLFTCFHYLVHLKGLVWQINHWGLVKHCPLNRCLPQYSGILGSFAVSIFCVSLLFSQVWGDRFKVAVVYGVLSCPKWDCRCPEFLPGSPGASNTTLIWPWYLAVPSTDRSLIMLPSSNLQATHTYTHAHTHTHTHTRLNPTSYLT